MGYFLNRNKFSQWFCHPLRTIILVFIATLSALQSLSAQPITLQAGRMKSLKRDGKTVQWLKENVRFEQSGSNVYCDEAEYDPQTQDLLGRGNIRITNPDGAIVTGKTLEYNNATHTAKVIGNVKLIDGTMELSTPWIEYNTQTKVGWYGAGGNIIDKETTLSARSGSYNPNKKALFFKTNVVLTTPEYTVKTDTLQYRTDTKRAQFFAQTQLDYQTKIVVFQRGFYLTDEQKGEFYGQVALFDQGKIVVCDTLFFDKITQVGLAHGHVYIQDSIDQWKVWGNHALYNGLAKSMKVWNQALAFQGDAKNPFKLKADTLAYNSDSAQPVALKATYNVAFSQDNTSGKCNKLTSKRSDSTFYFSGDPVLYDSLSRVSGDSIEMRVVAQKVKELKAFKHGFVAIQEDSIHFSQIQGDSIHQWIDANQKIEKVRVVGNAQSIYYLRNADTLESANLVTCKSMKIGFKSGKINQITFYEKPVGTLYPIDQLPAVDAKLKGFVWDMQNKPSEKLFLPPHTVSIPELPYPKGEKTKKKSKKSK